MSSPLHWAAFSANELALSYFKKIQAYRISENKIILWSKTHILHANLDDIRTSSPLFADKDFLLVKQSNFEIKTSLSMAEKKKA